MKKYFPKSVQALALLILTCSTGAFANVCTVTEQETQAFLEKHHLTTEKDLSKIEYLDTSSANFPEDDLKYLCPLSNLKFLYSYADTKPIEYKIHGPGLVHLKALPKLEYLDLDGNWLTADSLQYLQGVNSVKTMKLYFNPLTMNGFEGIRYLMGMENLESLTLQGHIDYFLTDEDAVFFKGLKNHPHLKKILLMGNQFRGTPTALQALSSIKNLEDLDFTGNRLDEQTDFRHLKSSKIKSLNLSKSALTGENTNYITTSHLSQLAELPQLEELVLFGFDFSPQDLAVFKGSSLKTLGIDWPLSKNIDEIVQAIKDIPVPCIVLNPNNIPRFIRTHERLENEGLSYRLAVMLPSGEFRCENSKDKP